MPNPKATGPEWIVGVVSESAFTPPDHGVHTAFIEQVRALRALGAEVCVNSLRASRRARVVVMHTQGPFALACLGAAGPRSIVYAHMTPADLVESFRFERAWRSIPRAYLRTFYRRAPHVVAVSTVVRDELLALGVDPTRLRLIPLGIDSERFARAPDPGIVAHIRAKRRGGRPLVLGVGQTESRKGIASFVAVAQALPDYDFTWVGGRPFGPLQPSPARLFAKAPPNVSFVGRVPEAELLGWYLEADVFLFPSRQENFGQVVVEAAAAGLPLVLSDLPVFRENFASGATLAAGEAELTEAVRRPVEDPDYGEKRIRAARTIAARFTARRSAESLLAFAAELDDPASNELRTRASGEA